jgi:uncharacterized membrane protein
MIQLVIGLLLFLGVHSIGIVASDWRDRTAERIGRRTWRALYSVASIVGFVLLIRGYGLARLQPIVLYTPPTWSHVVTALLMLPVFPLLIAAYAPGRIQAALKHPLLAAVKFWALAHLVANGTLADLLLFGGFMAWAVADRISFKRRTARPVRGAPPGRFNDAIAVVVGLALYALFAGWLHARWIGVPVWPLF